ncbi:hypothetical protein pb186bvf_015197 [Paramecium bursaria]
MKQKSLTMYGSFTRCESSSTRTSSVYGGNENRQYAQLDVIDEIIFENDLQSSEKDSETIMTSKYVIQVYDENHLNKIQNYEHDIFNSLLCQFIPVVFQDDIDLHKPNNTVPIILDYFTYNHNIGKSQEILSFEYLLMGRKSLQKITHHSASRKSTSSFKQHIRERSKSAQYICRTKFQNRELIVLNIDQKDQNEPKQEIPIKEVHQSITRGFYNQDEKSSPFYLQNEICIKTLLTLAFTSEDQQFFGLLVYSYQLFYENHVDFLKEVIKLYYSKKQQIDSQSNILRYLCFWIDLRSKDLMEDRENIFQIVGCFCQIAQLLNYGKSAMIEKQINTLSQKATSIVELRNTLFKLQLQRPQRKRRNSEEIQNKNSRQNKQHRKQQSHQFTKQSFQGIIAQYEFNDWSFYLQTPTIVLQRQLWIIDVEYFKKISITDLLNIQNGSSRALKEIADHFDYLLFHMVCSTIKCPKDQLSYLFQKFIILFQICMDAQHYQMCYLLQEYFNHVTDYLDYSYHLPYTHWQILKQIQSFDYQDKYIQYFQVNASIPVMAILQNQIYKLSKFEQHINISRLDNLSLNLFQIGNLLYYEQKCQYDQFKQEVEYQFLKVHTKQSIQKFFNNTNKYCIQLELLRLK